MFSETSFKLTSITYSISRKVTGQHLTQGHGSRPHATSHARSRVKVTGQGHGTNLQYIFQHISDKSSASHGSRSHATSHARSHATSHARSHARSHATSHARSHARSRVKVSRNISRKSRVKVSRKVSRNISRKVTEQIFNISFNILVTSLPQGHGSKYHTSLVQVLFKFCSSFVQVLFKSWDMFVMKRLVKVLLEFGVSL